MRSLKIETRALEPVIKRIALLCGGGGALAVAAAVIGCLWAKELLFVEGGSRQAEVIVILGGDAGDRTFRALELFRAGAAPKILVSGDGECFLMRDRLIAAGVSTNALFTEANSRNTKENAGYSARLLRAKGITKAIVATSWFHSRRAMACFRQFGSGIEFSSFPAYHGINMERKLRQFEIPSVLHEYLGLPGIGCATELCHLR